MSVTSHTEQSWFGGFSRCSSYKSIWSLKSTQDHPNTSSIYVLQCYAIGFGSLADAGAPFAVKGFVGSFRVVGFDVTGGSRLFSCFS